MRRGTSAVLAWGAALLLAPSGAAAERPEILASASIGVLRLDAARTFEAVTGSATGRTLGGGLRVAGVWRGLFAELAISETSKNGERVSFENGETFPLGIPLSVRLRHVDVAGGWRWTRGRLAPYVGAGVTRVSYEEKSDFADAGENVSAGAAGPLLMAGVDVRLTRLLHVGGDVRFRRLLGILGEGGLSRELGERSAGGLATSLRVSIGG